MSLPTVSQCYTPEDLLAMPDGHRFDLVAGHLVERRLGAESSRWRMSFLFSPSLRGPGPRLHIDP